MTWVSGKNISAQSSYQGNSPVFTLSCALFVFVVVDCVPTVPIAKQ
jgi:hypothetical protein